MKTLKAVAGIVVILTIMMASKTLFADEIQTKGVVCGEPQTKCQMPSEALKFYQSYDLSFNFTQKPAWQNNYYSEIFYAVILKSKKAQPDDGPVGRKKCSGYFNEQERAKYQNEFKENKVFTSRSGCTGQMFNYTNYNTQYNFVAVYGGSVKGNADAVLKKAKALGYKDANIRKMQAVFTFGD